MKRKDWLFAAFLMSIILLLTWIILLFIDAKDKSTSQTIFQWMMVFVFISNVVTFHFAYKNELKKEAELQNNKSGSQ